MLTAIRQWVIKTMMKNNTGVVQTLPKRDLIELNTQITAQRLMQNGIDPNSLKNANQVENAVNAIESRPRVQEGIKSTKSAKVMDMEGKEIKDPKNIMGGKEINQQTLNEELMKTDNPYSNLVKTTNQKPKSLKERESEILAAMEKNNKEAAQRIKNRKMVEEAIENASPGFAGDRKYDAQLVADDLAEKKFGKEFSDLDQKQQIDLYDEAYQSLYEKQVFDPPEDFAQGGRAGFDNGGAPNIKLFPRASGRQVEGEVGPGLKISERDLNYGITGLLQGDKFFGGAELDKGKVKIDVVTPEGDTLFKDTMGKKDAVNFILGMGDPKGEKFQIKTDKDFENIQFVLNKSFADGGRASYASGGITALKSLLNYFAKQRGTKGSQQLKEINPKSVPSGIMNIMGPEHRKTLEKNQTDYLESLLGTIKSDKKFLDRNKEIAKQVQKDIDEAGFGDLTTAEEMLQPFIKSAMKGDRLDRMKVYDKINVDDAITEIEQMIKNRRIKESDGRALNATGGRAGFDKGGMTRRTFLKLLGGMAAIPIVGKFLKPLKTAKGVKKVPMIATDNVPGKPEWFDQLVNKVILEGDDVTKTFATGERQSIHQKRLDDGSVVRVTEDIDDGAVRVEYESETNVFGDTATMEYKKPLPDEGDPNPAAEFTTAESGPVGRQSGPDDYDIEIDEVGGSSISDLDSDVSKLKEFATGKKPTIKEMMQNMKRKDKAKRITFDTEAQSDAVIRRQGEMLDYDDYASGGIARMLGE